MWDWSWEAAREPAFGRLPCDFPRPVPHFYVLGRRKIWIWSNMDWFGSFWEDFSPESDPKMAYFGPFWWSQSWCSTICIELRTWNLVLTFIWFIEIIISKTFFLGQPILELWHFNFEWSTSNLPKIEVFWLSEKNVWSKKFFSVSIDRSIHMKLII